MLEPLDERGPYALLSKAALPLSAWMLYGFFFIEAFLVGSTKFERILFCIIATAVSVCLWEITSAPMLVEKLHLKDPIISAAGALLVYEGVHLAGTTPVIAAAVVGTLAGFFGLSGDGSRQTYAGPAYCGAFVGMTSSLILVNPWWVVGAGLLAGYFYSVSGPVVRGIGGKMGSTAFGGAIIIVLLVRAAALAGPGPKVVPLESAAKLAILIASMCSAPISYWLAQVCGLGPIVGSALPSAVVALALHSHGHWVPPGAGPAATAWFGASFVGMTLPQHIGTRHGMLPIMGLLYAILWIGFKAPLEGIGGGLGATAAISVLGVIGGMRFFALVRSSFQSSRRKSWSV